MKSAKSPPIHNKENLNIINSCDVPSCPHMKDSVAYYIIYVKKLQKVRWKRTTKLNAQIIDKDTD